MTYSARDWEANAAFVDREYRSTGLRGPTEPLVKLPGGLSEHTGPMFDASALQQLDDDLTKNGVRNGEPLGERIVVTGHVLDDSGQPVPNTMIEIWQCNAAGRYVHSVDQHDAPLDPNFLGAGRCVTDANGCYRYYTIKPGAYPWGNHPNAWRPAHIHLSLFGCAISSRLITQMYFPGDPLLELDPIFKATPAHARERLVADFDIDATQEAFALGYRFDVILRGASATPSQV